VNLLQVFVVSAKFDKLEKYVMELDASDLVLIQNVMECDRVCTAKHPDQGYDLLRFLALGDSAEYFSKVALCNCPFELLDPTKFKKNVCVNRDQWG
jgi:hypothetical protein